MAQALKGGPPINHSMQDCSLTVRRMAMVATSGPMAVTMRAASSEAFFKVKASTTSQT